MKNILFYYIQFFLMTIATKVWRFLFKKFYKEKKMCASNLFIVILQNRYFSYFQCSKFNLQCCAIVKEIMIRILRIQNGFVSWISHIIYREMYTIHKINWNEVIIYFFLVNEIFHGREKTQFSIQCT